MILGSEGEEDRLYFRATVRDHAEAIGIES